MFLILPPPQVTPYSTIDWMGQVRALLGVESDELPDEVLLSPLNLGVAEGVIIRRVPQFATITDPTDTLFLQMAVIAYMGYVLAPSMAAKVKSSVQTLDMKWTLQSIDWEARAKELLDLSDYYVSSIQTVDTVKPKVQIFGTAKATPRGDLSPKEAVDLYGWWGTREAYNDNSQN